MKLIALMAFPYAGRELRAGDPFTASAQDAMILCGSGRAQKSGEYARRDMQAGQSTDTPAAARRKYKRRDMKASA